MNLRLSAHKLHSVKSRVPKRQKEIEHLKIIKWFWQARKKFNDFSVFRYFLNLFQGSFTIYQHAFKLLINIFISKWTKDLKIQQFLVGTLWHSKFSLQVAHGLRLTHIKLLAIQPPTIFFDYVESLGSESWSDRIDLFSKYAYVPKKVRI